MSLLDNVNPVTPKEKQKERLTICLSCEFLGMTPVIPVAKCNECGCPIRSKIALKNNTCPKGKW